jgi:hypothetical protein
LHGPKNVLNSSNRGLTSFEMFSERRDGVRSSFEMVKGRRDGVRTVAEMFLDGSDGVTTVFEMFGDGHFGVKKAPAEVGKRRFFRVTSFSGPACYDVSSQEVSFSSHGHLIPGPRRVRYSRRRTEGTANPPDPKCNSLTTTNMISPITKPDDRLKRPYQPQHLS